LRSRMLLQLVFDIGRKKYAGGRHYCRALQPFKASPRQLGPGLRVRMLWERFALHSAVGFAAEARQIPQRVFAPQRSCMPGKKRITIA